MSAQQDVAIVEDGLAGGAGRAETSIAAIVLDFMCLCEHGRGLFFAEKFLSFIGSEERDDIIDAADIGFKLSQQSFGGSLLTGLIDSGEVGFGGFLSVCVQILCLSGPTYHFPVDLSNTVSMLVYTITLFFLKWVDECKEKVYYTI